MLDDMTEESMHNVRHMLRYDFYIRKGTYVCWETASTNFPNLEQNLSLENSASRPVAPWPVLLGRARTMREVTDVPPWSEDQTRTPQNALDPPKVDPSWVELNRQ